MKVPPASGEVNSLQTNHLSYLNLLWKSKSTLACLLVRGPSNESKMTDPTNTIIFMVRINLSVVTSSLILGDKGNSGPVFLGLQLELHFEVVPPRHLVQILLN